MKFLILVALIFNAFYSVQNFAKDHSGSVQEIPGYVDPIPGTEPKEEPKRPEVPKGPEIDPDRDCTFSPSECVTNCQALNKRVKSYIPRHPACELAHFPNLCLCW